MKTLAIWLIIAVIVFVGITAIYDNADKRFTYSELVTKIEAGQVSSIDLGSSGKYATVEFNDETSQKQVNIPDVRTLMMEVEDELKDGTITLKQESESIWITIISLIAPLGLLIIFFVFWFLTMAGRQSGNKTMSFGKSRARVVGQTDKNKVTFNDVAGVDEEKQELQEIVEFLKNPKKFTDMGARIPKGVLLVGPPGTGKTLLAKAVAGEANVPFYYISGSDFVELYVGVGASRVRDMFKEAKHNAPCLIFIDEIDAVGRQRGTGLGGGHDEREQTLNQLLTEMDGFGANEGIIIIAATNRADVLDPALLRPGRFDRQVIVNLPDVKGREEILEVHSKNKILAPSVSLKNLAKRTPGFSGADLENLMNEAALLAVRSNKEQITMKEIDEATDRVLMGPAKKSKKYTEAERRMVAFHEAGHAVIGIKLSNASEVQKVTIIPRGHAGGYNLMVPKEEKYTATKTELIEEITGLLGGRVSEELTFGEISTGAHNDFEKATKIARAMVTEYGMSDLGPVQLEQQEGGVFLGRDYGKTRNFSNEVAHEIDLEMRKIIDECYKDAQKILSENADMVKLIAETLLEYETLTKEQIEYLVKNGHMPEDSDDDEDIEDLKNEAKVKKIKGYSKMSKEELIDALGEQEEQEEQKDDDEEDDDEEDLDN